MAFDHIQELEKLKRELVNLHATNRELRNENSQLHDECVQFYSECSQLRFENDDLRAENTQLKASTRRAEIENRVLKSRDLHFDPLFDPIRHLPAELQQMIQVEALKLGRPTSSEDLSPFITFNAPYFPNKIQMPLHLRPRYFKTFLRSNTVDVEALVTNRQVIREYSRNAAHTGTLRDCIRSLRLNLYVEDLFRPECHLVTSKISMLKRCTQVEHLEVCFVLFLENVMGIFQSPAQFHDSEYLEIIKTLRKLGKVELQITAGAEKRWRYLPATFAEDGDQWLDKIEVFLKAAALESSPTCKVVRHVTPWTET